MTMNTTAPKPFVFVLMPFDPEFDDLYQLGIKPACEKSGAYAERVDEQLFGESILERIYNQISKADVIVSDLTGRNANVFYETGYAHALGKKVILITKKSEDIPFDLKHYPNIIHEGSITRLLNELTKKVAWALALPRTAIAHDTVQLFIDGQLLPNEEQIRLPTASFASIFDLKIDAHNSTERQIRSAKFRLGILVNDDSELKLGFVGSFREKFRQPDGKTLIVFKKGAILHPGSWKSFSFSLFRDDYGSGPRGGDSFSAVIRLFSEFGVTDVPFSITVVEDPKT